MKRNKILSWLKQYDSFGLRKKELDNAIRNGKSLKTIQGIIEVTFGLKVSRDSVRNYINSLDEETRDLWLQNRPKDVTTKGRRKGVFHGLRDLLSPRPIVTSDKEIISQCPRCHKLYHWKEKGVEHYIPMVKVVCNFGEYISLRCSRCNTEIQRSESGIVSSDEWIKRCRKMGDNYGY